MHVRPLLIATFSPLAVSACLAGCDRGKGSAGKTAAAADSATAEACTGGATPMVTPGGVGPVKVGAKLTDVARRCTVRDTSFVGPEGMRETGGVVQMDGHRVLVLTTGTRDSSISRIIVTDSALHTERGIGIGSRVGDIRAAYGQLCAAIGEGNVVVTAGPVAGVDFAVSADYGRLARARPPVEKAPESVPDSAHVTRLWITDDESKCGSS